MKSAKLAGWLLLAVIIMAVCYLIENRVWADKRVEKPQIAKSNKRNIKHLKDTDQPMNWLMQPKYFDKLSTAGKRAVLARNGLIPTEQLKSTAQNRNSNQKAPKQLTPTQQQGVPAPGVNIRANDPNVDMLGHTQSESSIAVNGSNIVIGFNDSGGLGGNSISGYGFSTDNGATFKHQRIPEPPRGQSFGDPVLAYGPNGELYYSTLASDSNSRSFIGVAKSNNNGSSFSAPVDASTNATLNDFQDKEWITVDNGSSSPFKGNVYVSWTNFFQTGEVFINFSRSTNGGNSFETPLEVSDRSTQTIVQGSMPAVGPNGEIYIAYLDFGNLSSAFNEEEEEGEIIVPLAGLDDPPSIQLVKSTDGGNTFSTPITAASINIIGDMTGGEGVRAISFPYIAVDQQNRVHIVYASVATNSTVDRSDVFYVRSLDGGKSFSAPLQMNDDGTTTAQFNPTIAATNDGKLGIKWWDRRNDPQNDGLTDIYMTISPDGGATFSKNFRVTDHNWVFGPKEFSLASGYHGDYDAIVAGNDSFFLCWSDERNNDADVYFTRIPANHNAEQPDFNLSAVKLYDSIVAGSSADFDLASSGFNGFTGMVSVSASPAINGLSYSFTQNSMQPGQANRLTISTSANIQPGTYLITVTATGNNLTRKTNLRLNVVAANSPVSLPINISQTRGFTNLTGLKTASNGTIHVIFEDDTAVAGKTGNEICYSQSQDNGRSYSAPIKISTNSSQSFDSQLALDNNGNPNIVWTTISSDGLISTLSFSNSTDGGKTFSSPRSITSGPQSSSLPAIAISATGKVIISYNSATAIGFFSRLQVITSIDGGQSFSIPVDITGGAEVAVSQGLVAFDSKGMIYLIYRSIEFGNQQRSGIKLAIAKDGENFANPKLIVKEKITNTQFKLAVAPTLAIDQTDGICVAYSQLTLTATSVKFEITFIRSSKQGKKFSQPLVISKDVGTAIEPEIITGSNGNLSVIFEGSADDVQTDVFVAQSRDNGGKFLPAINISQNSGVSKGGHGAVDAQGKFIFGWTDDSAANSEVFINTQK